MTDVPAGHLYLGGLIDHASGERTGEPVHLEASDLTTHGVIVGMTGSGKTGLSVIMLEEALLQGIPTVIIDPKGDMGNLLLTFPELDAESFEPWVNAADAERDGISVAEHASRTAEMWKNGLDGWGIGPDRLARLREAAEFTIYTPGSGAGVPLDIIGDLNAPTGVTEEALADEVEGFVSSLLGLVEIDADPLSSREHILLSNLIHRAWSAGQNLDLATLLGDDQHLGARHECGGPGLVDAAMRSDGEIAVEAARRASGGAVGVAGTVDISAGRAAAACSHQERR